MIFFLAAAGLVLGSCGTKQPEKTAGINYDYMDTTVKPGIRRDTGAISTRSRRSILPGAPSPNSGKTTPRPWPA